jgi:hypothetical protein
MTGRGGLFVAVGAATLMCVVGCSPQQAISDADLARLDSAVAALDLSSIGSVEKSVDSGSTQQFSSDAPTRTVVVASDAPAPALVTQMSTVLKTLGGSGYSEGCTTAAACSWTTKDDVLYGWYVIPSGQTPPAGLGLDSGSSTRLVVAATLP